MKPQKWTHQILLLTTMDYQITICMTLAYVSSKEIHVQAAFMSWSKLMSKTAALFNLDISRGYFLNHLSTLRKGPISFHPTFLKVDSWPPCYDQLFICPCWTMKNIRVSPLIVNNSKQKWATVLFGADVVMQSLMLLKICEVALHDTWWLKPSVVWCKWEWRNYSRLSLYCGKFSAIGLCQAKILSTQLPSQHSPLYSSVIWSELCEIWTWLCTHQLNTM